MKTLQLPLAGLVLALASAFAPAPATAIGLVDAWLAARANDRDFAVARATQSAAQPRRDLAASMWRPQVGATATVGVGNSQSEAQGAQFSAPGLGTSSGVGFNTSVNSGTMLRWALSAVQPLYNPQRRAQQEQLTLSIEVADLEADAARQDLMLNTAQRYFDVAVAEEALRVLELQHAAVQRATTEAQDRFRLGALPVTDTQEAGARLAAIRAQVLAAKTDLQLKRSRLADSTGMPEAMLATRLPAATTAQVRLPGLDQWLTQADGANHGLRLRRLAATIADKEASKFSLRASPTVDLVAQAGRDRLSGHGDFGSAANSGANRLIGVQLSIPLYSGGYRDAKEDEARRLADKARSEVEQARQQVAQQVRASWLGLSVGEERLQALADGLAASRARRDATELGQQVGHRTTQDLMNAENDQAAAQLVLTQARIGLLIERLRLAAWAGQLDEALLRTIDAELQPVAGR